jgi:hypothetical protein
MAQVITYSFLDVHAAIVGPGGSFNLGAGAANAEEGIDVEAVEDIDILTIGADGTPMHTLRANKAGKVTVRLLKTSPVNQQLADMLAFQRTTSANHGQNTITIANSTSGDVISCQQVAFAKVPALKYATAGGINEWEFNAGIVDVGLGAGVN